MSCHAMPCYMVYIHPGCTPWTVQMHATKVAHDHHDHPRDSFTLPGNAECRLGFFLFGPIDPDWHQPTTLPSTAMRCTMCHSTKSGIMSSGLDSGQLRSRRYCPACTVPYLSCGQRSPASRRDNNRAWLDIVAIYSVLRSVCISTLTRSTSVTM